MEKLLVIVRHGDYGRGDEPLSEFGIEQMQKLRKVINASVLEKAKASGEENVAAIFFSFSILKRAIQSIRELHWAGGGDIIVTNEGDASRRYILKPQKILDKVLGLANYYGASVIVIVAHGEMPSVIAETAHEFVVGKKLDENLPYVGTARGFIVNMVTGEVLSIGYDSLDEKKPLQRTTQEIKPEVVAATNVKTHDVPKFVSPNILRAFKPRPHNKDDDIPF